MAAVLLSLAAQARDRQSFDKDWRFILGDSIIMAQPGYDDSKWRRLDVPHDWAIEGDFYVSNPSGAGGGALPGGIGWYRKHLLLPELGSDRYFIEFDGVYMNSTVYVNGKEVGFRPYGYSSFEYDITPYLKAGDNVVAVRVNNSDQPNSRWYSGCGIYRHVWLTKTNAIHVKHWGVRVTPSPPKLGGARGGLNTGLGSGKISVEVQIENPSKSKLSIRNTVISQDGKIVADQTSPCPSYSGGEFSLTVKNPQLWSCETPNIYKVRTQVKAGGKVVDTYETVTGFRTFKFDPKTGFWLNGKNFKLNGVCEHHDFGC